VQSQADRLSEVPERGERPGYTDLLTLKRVVGEIQAHLDEFPADMRRALRAWLGDASYDDIATELGLVGADAARALVRAALARLRERFRGEWPDVFATS